MIHRSAMPLALACAALLPAMPVLGEESGFLDGARTDLLLRNYAFNRDFRSHDAGKSVINEWAQGFILKFTSGYTPGVVGVGLDAIGLLGVRLDSSPEHSGSELLPVHGDGHAARDYGRAGAALKLRLSASELKVGEMLPDVPVLRYDDGRLLPQTFQGAAMTSREINGLGLYAGHYREVSLRHSANMQKLSSWSAPAAESDGFSYAGAEYRFNADRTLAGAWHAQLDDIYRQSYLNLVHKQVLGGWTLGANLGLFMDRDEGRALAGEIDSHTGFALLSAGRAGHTLWVGVQKVGGTGGWQSVYGASGRTIGNDMYNGNFTNADERSWQLRHDYDFAALGVPGLGSMIRYGRGSNATTRFGSGGKEWERDLELNYTVQGGPLKYLNLRVNHASNRRSFGPDFDQTRLIINYPISL